MNGAQALINTLVDGGVDVCFANPGTSEMHFVAALDAVPRMRGMLTLFEGVATGAADGYARIAGRPAAVLLHLGPGLGNGLANLHNVRRARVPMVVVVGDHATYHKKYDAPLESDIDAVAGTVSGWVRRTEAAADVGADAEAAIAASRSGSQIATLILPADVCWSDGAHAAAGVPAQAAAAPVDVGPVAGVLRSGEPAMMLIGGDATRGPGLTAAARIVQATGARWLCETFPTCLERGAGIPAVERLAYFAEGAAAQLDGVKHLVLAGARSPVSFFAYPGMPSDLVPAGCEVHVLAEPGGAADALAALADEVAPGTVAPVAGASRPQLPTGDLTSVSAADVVGALLPERAIVVDESNTCGVLLPQATAGAPAHDWLTLTGGAIGYGIPAAVGAAVAAPDARCCAWNPTGRQCTRFQDCGAKRGRTSTSPPSSTTTAPTTFCGSSCNVSARGRILARRPWISLIYRVPQWISSRSPKVWVFLHVVSPPARNSPTPCARPSPSPGRI